MFPILILKTGALGDVVRTTAILPGLHERHPGAHVTWLTASGAKDLVRLHPQVAEVLTADTDSPPSLERAAGVLAGREFDLVVSLDDEEPLCRLASGVRTAALCGARLAPDGRCAYTDDAAPWFDMGLLSRHGRAHADRLKIANRRSHPEILCAMLGVPLGKPRLEFAAEHAQRAREFAEALELHSNGPAIGLNTGAGGRWRSKMLSVERTADLARRIAAGLEGRATFVLFGGVEERERNAEIAAALAGRVRLIDAGVDNALLDFAARVDLCDLMISSDSLGMHVALARNVRTVAFFAPTSAAEIEMYGLGEKVQSLSTDYCSYRPDADTSTLTPERLAQAALRQLRECAAAPRR